MPSEWPELPGITILGLDRRTAEEEVFAGRTDPDGRPVRVRRHRVHYPTPRQLAARRHGRAICEGLADLPVILIPEVIASGFDLALVTAAPGLDELDRWMAATPGPTVAERLQVARSLAAALAAVHERGVTHSALSPACIAVETDLTVRIGGFDRAMSLRSEASGATGRLASLVYVAPEQTGRMNRPVDTRSDLYSLGAILHELFGGSPPFTEDDPLALVHAHVARPAPRLPDDLPPGLAELVATLLQKDPDRRYQTASGVAHDLSLLAAGSAQDGAVTLRSRDVSAQLVLSEHLYGRERETAVLAAALDRAAAGAAVPVFVAGYSGIGKSSLVHELDPMVVARFGWFCEGKFDLYQRDTPYAGWVAVIDAAVRQLLALPEAELGPLRATLAARLGEGAPALARLCPAVQEVIGSQPPPAAVTPGEARVRLALAVATFVAVIATVERPLVIFLDDLQWADLPSLRLLEDLVGGRSDAHVVVVGAWRDNEITSDHPVRSLLRHLDEAGVEPDVLTLPPLEAAHVRSVVADALVTDEATASELAALVHDKTAGNPFFIRQFLQAMHRDGILAFDGGELRWRWDHAEVAARSITDNVAVLLEGRLVTLAPLTLEALQAAAVVGSRFSLSSVTRLAGRDAAAVARALDDALVEQLVTPLDEHYRYVLHAPAGGPTHAPMDPCYGFLHDRVRQAGYDTLSGEHRRELHLRQAQLLTDGSAPAGDDATIEVASHLCEAADLLTTDDERRDGVESLLRAATRAKATTAVAAAARFLDVAERLLPDDAWTVEPALTLAVHREAADVAYIDGRYADATALADAVLARVADPLERVPLHNVLIGIGVASADYGRATQQALDLLERDFEVVLPRHPTTAHVAVELARCRAALGRRRPEELLAAPPMRDPTALAVMGIFMKTATNAYWAEPNLVPVIAARMVRLSLQAGNDSLTAYGFALYGMVTGAGLGAEGTAYTYGGLAMDLLERMPDRSLTGRTALLWHGFIRHSRDPLRECAVDLFDTYHAALEVGDVENACYCAAVGYLAVVLTGTPLPRVVDRYGGYADAVADAGQEQTRSALAAWVQAVELLRDPATRHSELRGDHFDWAPRRAQLLEEGEGTALPSEAAAAGLFAFLMDDLDAAERDLALMWEHRVGAPGQVYLGPCMALYAVTLLRRRPLGRWTAEDRARLWAVRRQVRVRARHNPHDMEPFHLLVEAEARRAEGQTARAVALYLDVATVARERGVLHLEALALDEAGALEAASGHTDQAAHLAGTASEVWRRYGAAWRVTARLGGRADMPGHDAEVDDQLGALDLRTLIETMQAISGELTIDGLLERVVALTVRTAGATRGVLVAVADGVGSAVAEGWTEPDGSVTVERGEAATVPSEQEPVVDYVVRTGRAVLVEDASTHELVRGRGATEAGQGSLLCAPLVQAGTLVGVVLLSNPQSTGVFTPRQLAIVETMCGQAAVTLTNAQLFEEQRAQAASFSRFVPRPFLEQLGRRRIREVGLGDAIATDITVSFSDLRGFTEVAEGLSALESLQLLNRYLGRMELAISRHGGFIDKYVGDAVMSLFIQGADGAVAAAIDMHRALAALNAEHPDAPPLRMGIGIHAGEVVLGTVGSAERLETTVIGDTVNTASRLEGASKQFCGAVLISRQVLDRLENPGPFLLREVGRITVKGKAEVLEVHEVLAARPPEEAAPAAASRDRFAAGLAAWYAADFAGAARHFAECRAEAPTDELPARYLERCEALLAHPPEGRWLGVEALSSK